MSQFNPQKPSLKNRKVTPIKSIAHYLKGIAAGDRYVLAEAITLLESNLAHHRDLALEILAKSTNRASDTRRIGVTGSPGVGKSTFIESIGQHLINQNRKVAVLTIDPSSAQSHGSILGDKTRMMELARSPQFFIRPSPSSNHLGGVHRYTYEAMCMCETAGYQDIIVETVGVGQSETEIRGVVDLMILLVLPGSGDSLQGSKKGIMETPDLIVVNKYDGDNLKLASEMVRQLKDAQHTRSGISIPIITYSSVEPTYQGQMILSIDTFFENSVDIPSLRREQEARWLVKSLEDRAAATTKKKMQQLLASKKDRIPISSESIFSEYLRIAKSINISIHWK